MTHILAIYTVIYVAILFTTVGIWAGDIATASGDFRILLFTLGAFSLKLAIDDYLHFTKVRQGLHESLVLSLLMYLFLAGSIANAALARPQLASSLFAIVFIIGSLWIFKSIRAGVFVDAESKRRHNVWLCINLIAISLLIWATALGLQQQYSDAKIPLTILFILVVLDFFFLGTLRRLAEEAMRSESPSSTGQANHTFDKTKLPPKDNPLSKEVSLQQSIIARANEAPSDSKLALSPLSVGTLSAGSEPKQAGSEQPKEKRIEPEDESH